MAADEKDRVSLKDALGRMNAAEKRAYVWEYYRFHILAYLAAFFVLAGILLHVLHAKTTFFSVEMVNASPDYYAKKESGDDFFADYLRQIPVDTQKTEIEVLSRQIDFLNPSVDTASTLQIMTAEFSSGAFDVFIAEEAVWERFAPYGAFLDLRDFLPDNFLSAHTELFFEVELEDTGEKVLAGIYLPESSRLYAAGFYDSPVPVGIAVRSDEPERAADFLLWALSGS